MRNTTKWPSCIARSIARLTEETEVPGSIPDPAYIVVEIDHEIFSSFILSLPIIQEGQLSVSGERMGT